MTAFTVLGAGGYVGSHLQQHLESAGHAVFAPERGDKSLFHRPLGAVIYCIGLTADFRTRPFDTVEAHVSFLADILERADFTSLVYLSSTRVYQAASATSEDTPLRVEPENPSDLYNLSKLAGESLCHSCGRENIRIARLSNVVGPRMDAANGNLIASLVSEARQGRITLQSSPDSAKDYIHIDDVVDRLARIALHAEHRCYNVASGIQIRNADWLVQLSALTGCAVDARPDAPLHSFPPISTRRIDAEFGPVRHAPAAWLAQEFTSNPSVFPS